MLEKAIHMKAIEFWMIAALKSFSVTMCECKTELTLLLSVCSKSVASLSESFFTLSLALH